METNAELKLAVLIDADNVPYSNIKGMLEEIAKYGAINGVSFCIYTEDNNNLLKACRNFISKYNKGRQPLDTDALDYWEEYIANNTYFGSLLKPIFDIKTSYQQDIEVQTEKLSNLFNSDMFENIVFE